jgi:type IV secretion system protein TrbL
MTGHAATTGGWGPLGELGAAAAEALGDVWTVAMTALWSAGLWILHLAFLVVDAVTTPDLSPQGPLRPVLGLTLWLGGTVAALMMFVQLGLVMVRRDGQSLGRLLLGAAQFGFVWVAFLGAAGGIVAASSGLTRSILQVTMGVDALAAIDWASTWPRRITSATTATVLGVTSLLLIIPGAFFEILISLVSEAALLVLVATSPITAAGLLHETTRAWWWKTLRWFIACVLIGPTSALVLGIGTGIGKGVIHGNGDQAVAEVGTAVVGAALVIVGVCCPLALFRLLAFVDPSTPSGAAVRQSWADATRSMGLPGGQQAGAGGSGAATAQDGGGRSQGESQAENAALSRVTSALGMLGRGIDATTTFATRATDLSADILGAVGVGAPSYSMTPADERALRGQSGDRPARGSQGDEGSGATDGPGPSPTPPTPPAPPIPPGPGSSGPQSPSPSSSGSSSGGARGGAGAAADAQGAAGAAPVIVP